MISLEQWCAGGGEPQNPRRGQSGGPNQQPGKQSPRILIIEDDFFVASHLEALLNERGFESCDIASTPERAINHVAEVPTDLVLVDVNLEASIDGVETLRRIQERGTVSAVFITAYTDPPTLRRISDAFPGTPVLHKPISPELLQATIDQVLRRSV